MLRCGSEFRWIDIDCTDSFILDLVVIFVFVVLICIRIFCISIRISSRDLEMMERIVLIDNQTSETKFEKEILSVEKDSRCQDCVCSVLLAYNFYTGTWEAGLKLRDEVLTDTKTYQIIETRGKEITIRKVKEVYLHREISGVEIWNSFEGKGIHQSVAL